MGDNNVAKMLSDAVEAIFQLKTQNKIAEVLGIYQTQLSGYLKNPNFTQKTFTAMLENFGKNYAKANGYTKINAAKVFSDYVSEEYDITNQTDISAVLGIKQAQLSTYLSKNDAGEKAIKGFLKRYVDKKSASMSKELIIPLLEFKKIKPAKFNSKYILLPTEHNKDYLKPILERKTGIYLFYNSQGKNIYIGKTEKDLYIEVTQQLSRPIEFYTEGLRPKKIPQGEVANYISVYEIRNKNIIKNIEALLIRAYANDNTNIKMENFSTV